MRKMISTTSTAMKVIIVIQNVQRNSESIAPPCAERTGGSHHCPQPGRRSAAEAGPAAARNTIPTSTAAAAAIGRHRERGRATSPPVLKKRITDTLLLVLAG